jgi:type IV secretory pathway TraG/TraD family ATPase VirD4
MTAGATSAPKTLVNNHRARLFGAGLADERSLRYVGRLLGDAEYPQESTTSGDGSRSVNRSTAHRPLVPPHRMREAAAGTALLGYGTLPPARITLRPWYTDPGLRRLVRR